AADRILEVRRRRRKENPGMQTRPMHLRAVLPAIVLIAVAAALHGQAPQAQDGVTHLRVTGEVVLPNVTRLGIKLGDQDYYDSGQMQKNLLFRNPGFEGMSYRTILH